VSYINFALDNIDEMCFAMLKLEVPTVPSLNISIVHIAFFTLT